MTAVLDIAGAWAARAPELAVWAMKQMVNRTSAYGLYLADGGSITAKDGLTLTTLERHYRGEITIGLHAVGVDNFCRYAGWDYDQHDTQDAAVLAARNLELSRALVHKLEQLGLYPLLEDSNGVGGFHVWVLFDQPRLARDVLPWARSITQEGCEVFPKQASVAPTPGRGHYGNFLRLPGRHHKRSHWSRFYVAGEWYEGDDAVDLLLDWTPSGTDVIPEMPEKLPEPGIAGEETETAKPSQIVEALKHLMRLKPERADDYDDWLHVGMILHGINPSPVMLAAWDGWSQQSSKHKIGECPEKWKTFDGGTYAENNNGRRLGIGTLIMMANEDDPHEEVVRGEVVQAFEQSGPNGIVLNVLDVSRTTKKYTARFDVLIDNVNTDTELSISDTGGGLRNASARLLEILEGVDRKPDAGGEKEIRIWLGRLATRRVLEQLHRQFEKRRAQQAAGAVEPDERPTMLKMAVQYMLEQLNLRFVRDNPMSVWSEQFGVLLRQNEFANRVEPGLLKAIQGACDYAAPTPGDPTKPIKHIQQVLKPAWCEITGRLPREVNADLGPESKAAAAFRQSIRELWLTPETWMKFEATNESPAHVERMSLASRVREMVFEAAKRPPRWQRVLKGINAFFRVHGEQGKDAVVWLGMRVDLCRGEIKGQAIRGIENQHDLAILANRYGLADITCVPVYITDNKRSRLLVLSREMCDYLINCEDGDDGPPLRANDEGGATQVVEGMRVNMQTGEVLNAP